MMNNKKSGKIIFLASSFLCLAFLAGCVSRESTVSREVSESGKDWSQTQLTQEYKGPRGQKIRDKQFVKEKIECISKKTGQAMTVDSEEECFKRGGKVVDEMYGLNNPMLQALIGYELLKNSFPIAIC